ncbi:arylamine N-acetyltransferase [Brevibacillus laterosporus]|uniref:arylamine N-acetyltransferase n=1 Tax=Brevibacillus laterosporus TaxID=1465 RepID=UPI003D21B206
MKLPTWAESYLHKIHLKQEEPSFQFLQKICRNHLSTIPFENISKLIYYREYSRNNFYIPPLDIVTLHLHTMQFGGTCYVLNSTLQQLLLELGFKAKLLPVGKTHIGILIDHPDDPGIPLYVDCASGAPFFEPVDFTRNPDNCSEYADISVHLVADTKNPGRYVYNRYVKNQLLEQDWTFDPTVTKNLIYFTDTVAKSFDLDRKFMSLLFIQLFQLDQHRKLTIHNNEFSIADESGKEQLISLSNTKEVEEVIQEEFKMPKLPVREAIEVLAGLGIDIFKKVEKIKNNLV